MRDHQPERSAGLVEQGSAHGGVAVQVDIDLQRARHLGPRGLSCDPDGVLAFLRARGFLAGDIALVDYDLAAAADIE
jgi:hypothetical protein